ncbi:NAD(P)/FAD-dependent oxidoreductase [Phenylobacterium sp. LjRoot219]|uniref:NAD(P)/FAD-dependent oxidoreductase n=1 Tax=Phenylobacterium sp. LjRoot219 TaxID=3342283 RepID=UPI003ECCEA3A
MTIEAPAAAEERPQVVIVGGGFGGLDAAKALAHAPVDVTLIDRSNHHSFQPLLYQVATAALSPADVAWPIRSILSRQRNARVLMAEAVGVDAEQRRLRTTAGDYPYDFLVLATGATHAYFGHDEWRPYAPGLKRIEDATEIRRRILCAFERAEIAEDPAHRGDLTTFVVVGGGPTGVEMAGAIADIARQALPRDFRRVDPAKARVLLVEAGPRILPTFPEKLSGYAARELARMGVEVRTRAPVTRIETDAVWVGEEMIRVGVVIWAAGVQASPAAQWLGAEQDRAGRLIVNPDLSVPGRPEIYAVGDTAAMKVAHGRGVPGIAPAAKQMGRYVGLRIAALAAGRRPAPEFVYRHQGDLATLGRKAAIVKLDRLTLTGFVAWVFWSLAHIYFLIGLRNRLGVAFSWAWDYVTFARRARLITEPPGASRPGAVTPAPAK